MNQTPEGPEGPGLLAADVAREGLIERPGAEPATHDGTGRVDLSFTVHSKAEDGVELPPAQRGVRVPPGVTVFDAASWNGIAIDSTCGGHGTCHKCKIQITSDVEVPITRHDARTFTAGPAHRAAGGSAAWCTRPATSPSRCRR